MTVQSTEDALAAERARWDDAAPRWTKWQPTLESAARVLTQAMLAEAKLRPGARVLDLATGLGEVALQAAGIVGPAGSVVAIDLAPAMIAAATTRAEERGIANLELRVLDIGAAADLEGAFDAVLCRWGLMFVPDLEAAAVAIRRVMVPGARLCAAVWGGAERVPMIALPSATARRVLGVPEPETAMASPFSLSEPGTLERALEAHGLSCTGIHPVPVETRFARDDDLVRFALEMSSTVRALLAGRSEQEAEAVADALRAAANDFRAPDGTLVLRNEARLVVAEAIQ